MADNTELGEAMDWDDEVSDEGGFTVLPDGTYPFEIIKLEKERFEGSAKMAACPRAAVTLNILTDTGWVPIVDRLLLNTKTAWRVAKFFEGLGFQKNPETGKVPMAWNQIEGKQGWVKLGVRKYEKDGKERETNDVEEYLKPADWPQTPTTEPARVATPQQTGMVMPAQPQQTQHPGWDM